jgi:hypothetical protein
MGSGDWIVVDSYRTPDRTPVALMYLRSLRVDPASVRLVIASHFDSDHIRGLAEVLAECPNAAFACSAALGFDEFFDLVEANRVADAADSPTSEFDEVLQLIEARCELRSKVITPQYGLEGTLLFTGPFGGGGPVSEVWSLSPSSATKTAASLAFSREFPSAGTDKRPVLSRNNELSLVTWIRVGSACALLGGDLEVKDQDNEGWKAVVGSRVRPRMRAAVFKVPHHGSPNAHYEPVWNSMLEERPAALVAPFTRSKPKRPDKSDLARLCSKTPDVYVSSRGLSKPPSARSSAVERGAKLVLRSRRVVESDFGHVRVRVSADGSGPRQIETSGSAYAGCQVD